MAALAVVLAASPDMRSLAQSLESERVIETIVGSDVEVKEKSAAAEKKRVFAAIENAAANASEVRKKFMLDDIEIIFLPRVGKDASAIQAMVTKHEDEIVRLREEIEGNAMFFHAVNSHAVVLHDIAALEFDEVNGVTIFVAGSASAQ
jgi:hypothetical protein